MHPAIKRLLDAVTLEEKEQTSRYALDQAHTLKQLKAEGLALHPIIVTRKSFGYADYPEISFKLAFPPENNLFRDGAAIECFVSGEEPVKAVLLSLEGKTGEFRLFAPDFPEWIEDDGVGIKLAPDTRTTTIMKKVLGELETDKRLFPMFCSWHEHPAPVSHASLPVVSLPEYFNRNLNKSQQEAVQAICSGVAGPVILHGPPGTGKSTTLAEAILQLVKRGEKVLVSAPSNAAVDHLSRTLIHAGISLLRVGNSSKTDAALFPYTIEGKLAGNKAQKEIKALRIRADEFRRMALKYKRSFGKAEREQRNLLFKEVKAIRAEIRKLQAYNEEKLFEEAAVIAGTPIGLYDAGVDHLHFNTLFLDEAGQCIEPLAWCIFPLADNIVMAGDHLQLPPTVLSQEAIQLGFNRSVLETAIANTPVVKLLDTQYRMRESIAGFSSSYFYNNLLKTAEHLADNGHHVTFIDTAGSGEEEKPGADGISLCHEGEMTVAQRWLLQENWQPEETAFISPYSGQVALAREKMPASLRCSTIDSFQGQENKNIIVSLVRSNSDGIIGFLKDYRRMNVAITRAQEQLVVIGDSATIGADPFYNAFLTWVEKKGQYRTVWEFGE